jgi:hypothetical protein
MRQTMTGEVRLDERKATGCSLASRATGRFGCKRRWLRLNFLARRPEGRIKLSVAVAVASWLTLLRRVMKWRTFAITDTLARHQPWID